MGLLINDGHTRKGRINAVPGLHGQLDFEFRPMLAADVEAFEAMLDKAKAGRAQVELIAALVAKQLVSWSEPENPKEQASILRLPHPVLLRLRYIVQGLRPSDLTEVDTQEEVAEKLDEFQSTLLAQVEAARGN